MLLTIDRSRLNKVLSIMGRTTGAKLINPVLGCVLLTTKEDKLKLFTTNNEAATKIGIEACVMNEGGCAVPVTLLSNIVGCIPAVFKEIKLEYKQEKKQLAISYANNVYHVAAFEPEAFKNHAIDFKPDVNVLVYGSRLKTMLENTVIACETKNSDRPQLQGLKMILEKDMLEIAGTDSRRMCICRSQLPTASEKGFDVMIPGKMIKTLISHLSDSGDVMLAVNENRTMIAIGEPDVFVFARLMDVEFVDYKNFIPADRENYVMGNTAEILMLFSGAQPIAAQNNNLVSFVVKEDGLHVNAESAETGDASLKLKCETAGKTKEISVNCNYMIDVFRFSEKYQVKMSFGTKVTDPIHIKPIQPESSGKTDESKTGKPELIDYDFDWIVMPVRQS